MLQSNDNLLPDICTFLCCVQQGRKIWVILEVGYPAKNQSKDQGKKNEILGVALADHSNTSL